MLHKQGSWKLASGSRVSAHLLSLKPESTGCVPLRPGACWQLRAELCPPQAVSQTGMLRQMESPPESPQPSQGTDIRVRA